MKPFVKAYCYETTNTATYLISKPNGHHCAFVDCVLDCDPKPGCTSTELADELIATIKNAYLQLKSFLETHAHADHLCVAAYLRQQLSGADSRLWLKQYQNENPT